MAKKYLSHTYAMKPKVLLIQPPIQDFYSTPLRLFPLGLLQIATPLSMEKYEVKILDCHQGLKRKTISLPDKFRYIKKYYDERNKSPFRLFGNYYHFGISYDEIGENIQTYKPDIVGISCNFSPYYETSIKCAEIAKEINPKIITVFGGHHANVISGNPAVDVIIRGEAEYAFKDFVKNGKTSDTYHLIDNLDSLPPNNLSLIPAGNIAMIQTSRGCPLKCEFCAIPWNSGNIYRTKSPEKIIKEILHYKRTHIDIEDDNFTADMDRADKILDLIIKKARIKISAMNGLSYNFLNEKLLQKMKLAGFQKINLSFHKDNHSHFENIVFEANSLGIETEVHFIIGLPDEKPEQTMETLLYLAKLPCKIGGSIFYPVPGTPLFDKAKKPDDPSFWRLTLACAGQKTDQITFLYLVRMINFLKSKNQKPLGLEIIKKFRETGRIYKALKKNNEYIFHEEPLNENILEFFWKVIETLHRACSNFIHTKKPAPISKS